MMRARSALGPMTATDFNPEALSGRSGADTSLRRVEIGSLRKSTIDSTAARRASARCSGRSTA